MNRNNNREFDTSSAHHYHKSLLKMIIHGTGPFIFATVGSLATPEVRGALRALALAFAVAPDWWQRRAGCPAGRGRIRLYFKGPPQGGGGRASIQNPE